MSRLPFLLLAFFLLPNAVVSAPREFTSSNGVKITAEVISVENGSATIRRSDGKSFTIPVTRFSQEDQDFLTNWKPAGATPAAASSDWFQWRGPNRDGVSTETGLDLEWGEAGPELAWKSSGMGSGYSSVSIWEGHLYTLGDREGGCKLICVNLENGEVVWTAETGGGGDSNGTPTVDPASGLVFGVSKGGDLLAADAKTGEVKWKKNYGADFGGSMMSQWGYSESPLVDGDLLICTPGAPDALLAALDKMTGEVVWKTDVSGEDLGNAGKDGAGYGSVVISNGGGVKHYVQMVGRGLVGVSAENGELLWNYNRIANGTANVPTPIISGDYVFGSSGYNDGGSALLRLRKSGSNGVSVKEEYYLANTELQNHHGGMILLDGHVYLGEGHNNGFPQCIELESGKVKWDKQRGAGTGSAAIAYADGHLFFRYEDHTMALIEASPDEYRLKSSFRLASSNGKSWPQPVIHQGRLYLRDQDELLCYDIGG